MLSFFTPRLGSATGPWSALCFAPGRIDVAQVRRAKAEGAKPVVVRLESFERGSDDLDSLRRLRKALTLNRGRCTTLLSPAEYQLLQIETPSATEPNERMEQVQTRLKDMVETPLAHLTVDTLDIPTQNLAPGRPKASYAVIAGNAGIAPKVALFHTAGVSLKAIDIPELAQRNIAAFCEQENRALAFLTFDDSGGLLTFTANGELFMFRRIDIALNQLLTDDMDRRSTLYDRIGLEVQRSMDNFDRQYGFIPLARLLIGPQPDSTPLAGFMRDYLAIKVEVLDLGEILDISAIPGLAEPIRQAQCLQCLGAALRDEAAA